MPHLVRVALRPRVSATGSTGDTNGLDRFPFTVPAIRTLPELQLTTAVTFFVGENGTGKSTLLEAIAVAAGLPTVGSDEVAYDRTLGPQRALARELRLSWAPRSRRGFYLRAEDFFGYLKRQARDDARLTREKLELRGITREEAELRAVAGEHADERGAERYMAHYDARSHGESFLDLFTDRVYPGGLYLLDEPETPLSPQRQIALLGLIIDAAREGAQFIIATHSPILLACPGARILSFDTTPLSDMTYEELEHVRVTRDFLNYPERFLRHFR
jgi:predicted ATPase